MMDLKNELENKGLDKMGIEAACVDCLRKTIETEGENPGEYIFELSADSQGGKKNVVKESEDLSNGNKHERENGGEDDKQENPEATELLQVSLDDKEDTIDNIEDEQMDATESQNTTSKPNVSIKENPSDQISMDSTKTVNNGEKIAPQPITSTSTITKIKIVGKRPIRILSKQLKVTRQFAKSIWITNLPLSTRAADLKSFFSKHGKVILVKIVTSAKQTTGEKKFYGYVTLATSKEAAKAVQDLNNTNLKGQPVTMELTANQPNTLLKKASKVGMRKVKGIGVVARVSAAKATERASVSKDGEVEEEPKKEAKDEKSASHHIREQEHRSLDRKDYRDFYPRGSFRRPFAYRSRGRGRGSFSFRERPPFESLRRPFGRPFFRGRMSSRPPFESSFLEFKMAEGRQHGRMRSFHESERRAGGAFCQKLIERKQREESYRLEREKDQLRIERALLEREKAEYLKSERERQRMERERIEHEREKLQCEIQIREMPSKRPFVSSPLDGEPVWEREKRARHYEDRYPSFTEKPSVTEARPDFRKPQASYKKFQHRPDGYEREVHSASTSRSDFSKYVKEQPIPAMSNQDKRHVYKYPYFKEEGDMRSFHPSEVERYGHPSDGHIWGYEHKMHETVRSSRPRGGGGSSRQMPYY